MTATPARAHLPWHRRLEARVALGLGLLVAAALGAVLFVTLRLVSAQSRDRAAAELDVARTAFDSLLESRITSAISVAELVTQLPVLRAHLTDTQLSGDQESLVVMADGYRAQMRAQFAIVAKADGSWLASPGWPSGAEAGTTGVQAAERAARQGRSSGIILARDGKLFLSVSVPARFADEVLGTLTVGYALTDDLARELAHLARCEVIFVSGATIAATSLAERTDPETQALVAATTAGNVGVVTELQRLSGRQYVVGTFGLRPGDAGRAAGRLVLLSDWRPTQQFIDLLRGRFGATGLVVLAVSLMGGVFFSRRLSRPLRDIATAASEIAAGNLALRLPEEGSAEAVTVAHAFNDMSDSLRTAHDRLVHDAIHDHLTQLPNRMLFNERLGRALAMRERHPGHLVAVLFVDLDRFKLVNDSLGHPAGDRLLVEFAERLETAVRREDTVTRVAPEGANEATLARFGGDEFAILLDGIHEPFDAVRVAQRIQEVASQPLRIDDQDVFTDASIGVAVSSADHRSADDLVRDADLAMSRAKQAGRGGYAIFDDALHQAAVTRLQLETELRRALERREFRVWYQPVVSLVDSRVVGFEALVRWQHPDRGLLQPVDFLSVAEEVGLVGPIDEWVMGEACRQGRTWMDTDPRQLVPVISVNVSANAFRQEGLVRTVTECLRATRFPAHGLRVEITEGVAIQDAQRALAVLTDLHALGVRVSLDDFGTGYCSLSYLHSLPVDTLKIDRSFVARIGAGTSQGEIIKLIMGLARTLGVSVVAEGTETSEQVAYLDALGCKFGQGYYFAGPMPPDDAHALLWTILVAPERVAAAC